MRILFVTNHLFSTGGDWTYVNSAVELYRSFGHQVLLFGLKDERNIDQTLASYYVNGITKSDKRNKIVYAINVLKKCIYSQEAYTKMGRFLDKFPVDIVQLNSINIGLTPSIINAIQERKIPIVWRILDYKLICPTIYLRCGNEICEACKGGKYVQCIKKRCKNNSIFDSIAVAIETVFYSYRKEYSKVDCFSFQNDFTRNKYIEWGFDRYNTISIENPYDVSSIFPKRRIGSYVLYFGRLDKPKGVLSFVESAKINKDIMHIVVGTGDEENRIRSEIESCGMNNIELKGPVWGEEMETIIENARFVIVPSEWFEPSPYVVLQSFSHAKPVIASNIGGLPEMISDGVDGYLFDAGNINDLAIKIKELYGDTDKIIKMGERARYKVETKYAPQLYYEKTMVLFNKLINRKG